MDGELLALGVTVLGLLLVLAGLAAMDTVVTRVDMVRALRLHEEERRGAGSLLWLIEHRASAQNALLVATVTARVAMAALTTVLAWQLTTRTLGVVAALLLLVLVALVLSEAVPRTLALRHLEAVALALAAPARLLVRLLDPVGRLVAGLGRAVVPRRHEVSGPYADDEELQALDDAAEVEDEELEPEERAMIRSIFELADTVTREVMVPRPDMLTVPGDAPLDTIVRIAIEHGRSRIPVHDPQEPGTIVGIIYAKDLLRRLATEPHQRWDDLVRPPTFVPEDRRADDLLRELQAAAVHLAIVVDEYGEVVGLVTIEDILEEIVGEIVDEHDQEPPLIEVLGSDRWRVDARLGVDDLNELLGTELPEEGWDTVGGLVFGTLGRLPAEQDTLDLDGVHIAVERVQGRRVASVLVVRRERDDDPAVAEA